MGDLKALTVYPPGTDPNIDPSNAGTILYLSRTTYTYDKYGNQVTETRWRYKRDAATGDLLFPTNPNADSNQDSFTTTSTYDARSRPTKQIDATGATVETVYNNLGKASFITDRYNATTQYLYDKLGSLSCTKYPDGALAYQATYYDNGLRHHVLEDRHFPFSAGQKATGTRTVYDALGRATRTERVKDLVITSTLQGDLCETAYDFTQSATVFTRTRTDYYEDGRIWKTIQENDLATTGDDAVTIYEYAADQLTKTTKLPPIIDGVTTTTDAIEVHDVNGNVLSSQTQSWVDGVLQSHRPQTRFYYDQMNRHLRTRVAPNETVSDDRTVPDTNLNGDLLKEIQYDLANRRSIETTWDSGAENVKTKFDYDGVGHLIQVTPGYQTLDHTVTKYDYDELGNVFAQYDGNQFDSNDNRIAGAKATRFEYDVLGRRTKRTLPAGGTPEDWTHDVSA